MRNLLVIVTIIASILVVGAASPPWKKPWEKEPPHNPDVCEPMHDCAEIEIELSDMTPNSPAWPWPIAAVRKCILQNKGASYATDYSKQADGEAYFKNVPVKCCQLIQSIYSNFWVTTTYGEIYWNSKCTTIILLDVPSKSWPMIKTMFAS